MAVLLDLVMMLASVVLIGGALAVLKTCKQLEVSMRTVSALGIGAWGAWTFGGALQAGAPSLSELLGTVAVALWIVQAARRHAGGPMRRVTDFAALYDDHATFRGGS